MLSGGCKCGAIRYEVQGKAILHALCHCEDCRASSGAPATALMAFPANMFRITSGKAAMYNSAGGSRLYFCNTCGTGLYFTNDEKIPDIVDIRSSTLDNANDHTLDMQVQTIEQLDYMRRLDKLPDFERYPSNG